MLEESAQISHVSSEPMPKNPTLPEPTPEKEDLSFHQQVIAKTLGFLWVVDAALQTQPRMFTKEFVEGVIQPNLINQPPLLSSIINFGISLFNFSPFFANTGAFLIQFIIGIMIYFPTKKLIFRAGLILSIMWGLGIWIFGEGLGNLLTGAASFYTGAPGSVLIYIIVAILLLIPSFISVRRFALVAGLVFLIGGLLQFQPTFFSADGIKSLFILTSSDPIGWVSYPATLLSNTLSSYPTASNIFLALLPLILGIILIFKPSKTVAIVSIIFLIAVWWINQDLGGVLTFYSGISTDPNSAPITILLLIPILIGKRIKVPTY